MAKQKNTPDSNSFNDFDLQYEASLKEDSKQPAFSKFENETINWKIELQKRVKSILENALDLKAYTDLWTAWHELHELNAIYGIPNSNQKADEIHNAMLKSRIMVKTLTEFIHVLELCGYDKEDSEKVLNQSQKDALITLEMGYSPSDIYGYGLQTTKTKYGFMFEPMVLAADNFSLGEDCKFWFNPKTT